MNRKELLCRLVERDRIREVAKPPPSKVEHVLEEDSFMKKEFQEHVAQ